MRRDTVAYGPWIDRLAGRIGDPVIRLRFLKTMAPPADERGRRKRRAIVRTLLFTSLGAALLVSVFMVRATARVAPVAAATPPRIARPAALAPSPSAAEVWLVEKSADSETYSNGLRIENRGAVANHPRSYEAFPAPGVRLGAVRRSEPAGIVFHTTQSRQAPFEAGQNGVLKRLGESLLDYVRRRRAYNFLIDRFGRVHRVVLENHAANHAGHSVWGDGQWLYLNLNDSFLGVSFEAETQGDGAGAAASPAQVRAAAMLVEMLRTRYKISAANCVTHAQVSVNPSNMRVGYHTDWASNFPFEQLGLPNNYERPMPALVEFGFEYDPAFLRWAGTRLHAGVALAEETVRKRAVEAGLRLPAYRKLLRERYRKSRS